ncbi:MAG: hypothetical protein WBR18_08765 [Anaerolineales bacterium]
MSIAHERRKTSATVLPIYYSQVAGSTLPSPATAYWSAGLSIALLVSAILSPILCTISDVRRGKKPLLSAFVGVGVVATGLLVLVDSGDWLLAINVAMIQLLPVVIPYGTWLMKQRTRPAPPRGAGAQAHRDPSNPPSPL